MKILPFPLMNLSDIPSSLEQTAQKMRHGSYGNVKRCLVIMEDEDGRCFYSAFGDSFTRLQAVGLCEYVKPLIMGIRDD